MPLARVVAFVLCSLTLIAGSALGQARASDSGRSPAGGPASSAFVLRDVRLVVLDPPHIGNPVDVLVVGPTIAAIGTDGSIAAPPGARTIDGHGGYLLPGLIDSHVHIDLEIDLPLWLAHGVTTVRNMSGSPLHLDLRKRVAEGRTVGPRILTASPGMLDVFNESPMSFHAESPAIAAAGVARFAREGYDLIKTYRFGRDVFEALVEAAEKAGIPVAGHLHDREGDPLEVLPGMDAVSHLDELLWIAFGAEVEEVDLAAFARRVRATGAAVETLLTPAFLMRRAAEGGAPFLDSPEAKRVRAYAGPDDFASLSSIVEGSKAWSADNWARRRVPRTFLLAALRTMVEAGVTVVPGTDSQSYGAVAGRALLDELDLMVETGLTPARALHAATADAARLIGLAETAGRVAVGLEADLLLVTENPLESLDALRARSGVAARGRWYDAGTLDRLGAPPYEE